MKPTLEICLLVKNGGTALERCLRSAAPVADRILVCDTGSTDESLSIARSFGAEVHSIPWEQDFAQARNRVLDLSRCDWCLALDHDEMLDPTAGPLIREAIQSERILAYRCWRWNYVRDLSTRFSFQAARPNPFLLEESRPYPAYVALPAIRLFRNYPGFRWEGCVHETLEPSLARLGQNAADARFPIHHFGHVEDTESQRRQKNDLYHVLGEKKLQINGEDPQALMELGLSELDNGKQPAAALEYFKRAIRQKPDLETAWLFAGICLIRLGRLGEAQQRLTQAAALGLCNGLYWQTLGDLHYHSGRFAQACEAYEQLEKSGENSPLSEAKHGASQVQLGCQEEGLKRIRRSVAADPAYAELHDILMAAALMCGNPRLAEETLSRRMAQGKTTEFHRQIAAIIAAELQSSSQ